MEKETIVSAFEVERDEADQRRGAFADDDAAMRVGEMSAYDDSNSDALAGAEAVEREGVTVAGERVVMTLKEELAVISDVNEESGTELEGEKLARSVEGLNDGEDCVSDNVVCWEGETWGKREVVDQDADSVSLLEAPMENRAVTSAKTAII